MISCKWRTRLCFHSAMQVIYRDSSPGFSHPSGSLIRRSYSPRETLEGLEAVGNGISMSQAYYMGGKSASSSSNIRVR